MTTCREIFTFSWPLRGRGGGGQPKRSAWPLFSSFFFDAFPKLVTVRYAGQHVNGHWRSNIRLVLPLLTPLTTHSTFYSQRKYTLVKTSPQTYYQERRKPQNSVSCNVLGILETIAFYSSTHPVRHTAPQRNQPDWLGTLDFLLVLCYCDQDMTISVAG